MSYQSVNPATGKVLKRFKEITNKQLETSFKTAATCFETWRFKTFAERAVVVAKSAAILRARVDDFAKPVIGSASAVPLSNIFTTSNSLSPNKIAL